MFKRFRGHYVNSTLYKIYHYYLIINIHVAHYLCITYFIVLVLNGFDHYFVFSLYIIAAARAAQLCLCRESTAQCLIAIVCSNPSLELLHAGCCVQCAGWKTVPLNVVGGGGGGGGL